MKPKGRIGKPRGRAGVTLDRIIGKCVASLSCEHGNVGQVWAAQISFTDGSTLNIDIVARYCDDAWLKFEYIEGPMVEFSPETKAELDGLG